MFGGPHSILIVESKGRGKYAKQLYNLIGSKDDGDEPVGPVDGSIEASIFDERQFAATPLSSEQQVVFIGKPKGAEDYIDAIENEAYDMFDNFGVHIYLSGNQAYLDVSGGFVDRDEYASFLAFAEEHQLHFDDLLASPSPSNNEDESHSDNTPKSPLEAVGGLLDGAKNTIDGVARAIGSQADLALKAGDVEDQKFRFAVRFFYQEKLREFAGV